SSTTRASARCRSAIRACPGRRRCKPPGTAGRPARFLVQRVARVERKAKPGGGAVEWKGRPGFRCAQSGLQSAHSLLEETEIVDMRGPVRVRPRRAATPEARERIAADLLLVDHADIGTRRDVRLDLFFLDRRAGMRSAIRKRHALAPLGPDALLSEHA